MLNGSADRSTQSSPLKISTSPVRATSSPIRAPPSPLKSSLSSGSGRQKSPRRCQFAAPAEDARDKCGASWLCRRGAGAGEESETERAPGPSVPLPQGCGDDAAPPPKNCYRLVMLGSARVGKTSLVARFLGTRFEDGYTPTIEDFHRKLYRIRGEVHQLDLLDTSGNHPFPAMRRLSFLTGDIFVLVFSMDSRESFEEVIRLREQILETKAGAAPAGRGRKQAPRVPMAIAGNKCDKELKTVTPEEAAAYCATQDPSCVFVETSAKRNYKVDDLFYELFVVANLPLEMAPNHHKRVNTAFGSPCTLPPAGSQASRSKKCTLSIKRRLSDACGVVAPNVRRPSIRTDLMIMRTKTSAKGDSDSASGSPKIALNRLVRANPQADKRSCVVQ
ncbi:GTP-binding protein Rhes [Plutella xylostella]|uniref:GTP-binding protein Rhes n=1 Tax=Plutella xylostella TaxID=51655 RepID=UPI00203313ED|nr:GTP-binding protein Rhes [Plutella xylostella]XP_048487744.1 GTP-binding protein Rhes [Plutella xylostella]XP_048487745.1 GTP-binding protein Rhes [Plutella xylostella]